MPAVGLTVMVPLLSPLHVASVDTMVNIGVTGVVTSTALVVTEQVGV
jgi:hypothetical protein